MPDISLCMDKCTMKKYPRHPDQYRPHGYQTYAHFEDTQYCPKKKKDRAKQS